MNRDDTVAVLTQIGEARKAWAQAHIALNSDVYSLMRRMLHEAAVNRMSIEEVASLTGFTVSRVRQLMRDMGMNPKSSRSLLAKNSATVLAENATILGIEPSDFDLMSPLAYLPMGKDMRKTIEDKAVSQVHEVSGNPFEEFYAEHYPDWTVHELDLRVFVPSKDSPQAEALALVREILTEAGFDIKVAQR